MYSYEVSSSASNSYYCLTIPTCKAINIFDILHLRLTFAQYFALFLFHQCWQHQHIMTVLIIKMIVQCTNYLASPTFSFRCHEFHFHLETLFLHTIAMLTLPIATCSINFLHISSSRLLTMRKKLKMLIA